MEQNKNGEANAEATETHPLLRSDRTVEEGKPVERTEDPLSPSGGHRRIRSEFQMRYSKAKMERRSHHRRKSSISQVFESISNGLGVIAEDMESAAEAARTVFVHELEISEHGDRFFFDMSMTRSLSILPEYIPDFVEEATGMEYHVVEEKEPMMGRYLALLGAVIAVSSNGTALSLLKGVPPALKLYWRMTATAAVLSPFALQSLWRDGFPSLNHGQWLNFGAAVVCFSVHTLLFFTAFAYTSIGDAVIFANSQALLLILGKTLMGHAVVFMEGAGVVVAFSGAIMCSLDTERADDESITIDYENPYLGDAFALGAAAAGVAYLTFAKAVRPHMKVSVFMFFVMLCGSFLILTFLLVSGYPLSLDNDPFIGLFGWMNLFGNRFYILLYVAVICNVCGTMGFVRAMEYFDNLIIAVATLLEPMVASLIAYAFNVGVLPGPLGWMGNLMVAAGTLSVIYPSVSKGESVGH